jgi:hypothetical protein
MIEFTMAAHVSAEDVSTRFLVLKKHSDIRIRARFKRMRIKTMRSKSITAAVVILFALLVAGCSPKSESTSVEAKANAASAEEKPNLPPSNPFLMSDSIYPMIHWNSAATDVTTVPAWVGNHVVKPEQVQWLPMQPSSIGAAHYPYPDGEQAMILSGNNTVSKVRITEGAFELIDRVTIPGYGEQDATEDEIRNLAQAIEVGGTKESAYLPPLQAYNSKHQVSGENLAFGVYTLLDHDGNYYAGWGTTVFKVADEKPGDVRSKMKIAKSYDLKDGLRPEDAAKISRLLGLAMTYDGHIVVAMPGIIAVLDRDLNNMQYILLEGEAIDNGVTVGEGGGIYVVTSKYMRRLVWDGSNLSDREADGAWKSEYDYVPNPRAFSRGAGNTPTLMGFGPDEQHLVIIADAGDPVKIVAFWRDEIPTDFKQHPNTQSRRIAGELPLSIKVPATIEWSPHVYGYGTMMFASAWPNPVNDADGKLDLYSTVMSAGVSRAAPRGSEKFIWDPKTYSFKSAWTTDYGMQWALHPISMATNTVHLAELKDGVYGLIAIDWTTGKEVGRTTLGKSPIFNTMGGFFIPLENGDIYVTGVFGPVRISKDR